ncbi:hypothetical protein NQ314_007616 [Rhamnusium bicolor]|uniref:HAT C-terminal dimerisation domain-containing protein n=1 Tax=Rhamnusium bicolor TaxID=1586634 RepID=A0AAV8YKE8_9CUCU|nr:hypothetical protein NQ314_007616 [Rhamnusium bicolor]
MGPVLKFVSNINPKIAVSGNINSIARDSLNFIPNLVSQENIALLNSEWRMISDATEPRQYSKKSLKEFWIFVFRLKNKLGENMFPNLSLFIKAVLSLPHSSAAAERIFSQLNL